MRPPGAGGECISGGGLAAHIELDFARQLDDGFGVMAVLEQRVFDGLRAVDEQAAIETVLLLGDPVAAAVLANKDDCRWRAARWRFDELHVGVPSVDEWRAPKTTDFPSLCSWLCNVGMVLAGRRRDSCSQYLPGRI